MVKICGPVRHESCRRNYCSLPKKCVQKKQSDTVGNILADASTEKRAAHDSAFDHVCTFVKNVIIVGGSVVRKDMALRDTFVAFIKDNTP